MSGVRELKAAVRRLLAAIDAEREARAAMRASLDLNPQDRWIETVRELSEAFVAADRMTRDKRRPLVILAEPPEEYGVWGVRP